MNNSLGLSGGGPGPGNCAAINNVIEGSAALSVGSHLSNLPGLGGNQQSNNGPLTSISAGANGQNGQNAFLGPRIWDKTVSFDDDFKLEYMDLDEFLTENDLPIETVLQEQQQIEDERQQQVQQQTNVQQIGPHSQSPSMQLPSPPPAPPTASSRPTAPTSSCNNNNSTANPSQTSSANIPVQLVSPQPTSTTPPTSSLSPQTSSANNNSSVSAAASTSKFGPPIPSPPLTDGMSTNSDEKVTSTLYNPFQDINEDVDTGDDGGGGRLPLLKSPPGPAVSSYLDEDLKPTPVIRKRKKQMVSEDCKDDKYWERRRKNNMAAKRSRDARRAKENQIAIRASFLERENKALAQELSKARAENHLLRERLCKYEVV